MKLANKQLRRSAQSWMNRVEKKPPLNMNYNSELRDWLQHVILEAEKNKDFKRKDQFQSLLEDLNSV
ncbi:hypothetical protein GTO27_10490 [Candidatus Bathyarchaeota archaeon]|nr:hypothetical protein [Candidatus Bathyarchaeota archaeon]